jgi:riboflavin transporter FmnP
MKKDTTKYKGRYTTMIEIGMLSAIATVLMFFELPIPFVPMFYKLDFSEVPILIGAFLIGPYAAIAMEAVKTLLILVMHGSMTAGIGEIANFFMGCALCVPAGIYYQRKHTRKGACLGMLIGCICMTVAGCILNAYVLLPVYAKAFSMPMDALLEMGSAVNARITDLQSFVLLAVAPFNLLKGILVSWIVFLTYKKLTPLRKMRQYQNK